MNDSSSDQSSSNQPLTEPLQSNDNDEAKQSSGGFVINQSNQQSTSLNTLSNLASSDNPGDIFDPFQLPELEEDNDVIITGSVLKPAKPREKKSKTNHPSTQPTETPPIFATDPAEPVNQPSVQPALTSASSSSSSSTQSTSASLNQAADRLAIFRTNKAARRRLAAPVDTSQFISHTIVPKAKPINSQPMFSSSTNSSNKQSNNQQRSANPAPVETEVTVLPGTMPVTALDFVNHSSDQQQSRGSNMNANQQINQGSNMNANQQINQPFQNFPSQPGYQSQPSGSSNQQHFSNQQSAPGNQLFNQQPNMNQFNNNFGQPQQDQNSYQNPQNQQFNQLLNQFNQQPNNFPNQPGQQQLPALGGRQPMFQWHEEQIVALASQVAKLERAVETLNTENMNYVNENLRLVFENRRLLLLEKHLTERISKLEYDMITSGAIPPDTEDQMYWMDERLRTEGARLQATKAKYAANKRPRVAAAPTVHLNPPVQPAGVATTAASVAPVAAPTQNTSAAAAAVSSAPAAVLPTTAPVPPASARRPATAAPATNLSG